MASLFLLYVVHMALLIINVASGFTHGNINRAPVLRRHNYWHHWWNEVIYSWQLDVEQIIPTMTSWVRPGVHFVKPWAISDQQWVIPGAPFMPPLVPDFSNSLSGSHEWIT
jgi:hypothetical protein